MKRNWKWSGSMMFSYLPVFILTLSVVIFLSFLVVGELSRSQTKKANRVSTGYVVEAVENALRDVELSVLQEMETNPDYDDYLSGASDEGDRSKLYHTANEMKGILYRNQLVESVYLYRKLDGRVLTLNGLVALDVFPDQLWVRSALAGAQPPGWGPARSLVVNASDPPVKAISMAKPLPLPFGSEGLLALNVSMYKLQRLIDGMTDSKVSFMRVVNGGGDVLYADLEAGDTPSGKVLTRIRSESTGWTFESGIRAGELFAWMSVISYVWILLGILAVGAGIFYMTYVTRRNYRPIRVMMNRIQALQLREDSLDREARNELQLIDRALETLIRQTMEYQEEHDENLLVQRRRLFMDLMEGESLSLLQSRLERLRPFGDGTTHYVFLAVELNRYEGFRSKYPDQEQNMLKLTLVNLLQELAAEEGLQGWAEWISGSRIGLMVSSEADLQEQKAGLHRLAGRFMAWVGDHLGVSLTIGIGPCVRGLEALPESVGGADEALKHKLSSGRGMVVSSDDLPAHDSFQSYAYLQLLGEIVRRFRVADDGWRQLLEELFVRFTEEQVKDEDIHMMLSMLIQMLDRELGQLSEGLKRVFGLLSLEGYYGEIKTGTTLDEVREVMLKWLAEIYRIYVSVNESKSYRAMISEMRVYIEENFDNPDLSLKHLSDRFQISDKYASYLFKEEFDMRFVDFLAQLRMRRAEQLLTTTEDSLQDIAEQVGYANSISFGRVFKRVVGMTPGDYRKLRALRQEA
ncbi:helix-turn-helix domain-containing protein [Gorillibacterium sp. sgz5001074]|uniref:helix-turn-helix domain-containing protein n=1 Tax=Gorillibacterium sp. sgz5001074 TaxID=3446695 RepID=UPI003F674BC4